MENETFIWKSSGNAYADLGYPDADAMRRKAEIVTSIHRVMAENFLPPEQAAAIADMGVREMSGILHGKFRNLDERKLLDILERIADWAERRDGKGYA